MSRKQDSSRNTFVSFFEEYVFQELVLRYMSGGTAFRLIMVNKKLRDIVLSHKRLALMENLRGDFKIIGTSCPHKCSKCEFNLITWDYHTTSKRVKFQCFNCLYTANMSMRLLDFVYVPQHVMDAIRSGEGAGAHHSVCGFAWWIKEGFTYNSTMEHMYNEQKRYFCSDSQHISCIFWGSVWNNLLKVNHGWL